MRLSTDRKQTEMKVGYKLESTYLFLNNYQIFEGII